MNIRDGVRLWANPSASAAPRVAPQKSGEHDSVVRFAVKDVGQDKSGAETQGRAISPQSEQVTCWQVRMFKPTSSGF